MPTTLNPEVPVRAVIAEAKPGGAAVKPLVDKLRADLKDGDAESVAKSLSLRQPDSAIAKFRINENIGLERDASGKKTGLDPEEARRQKRAVDAEQLLDEYLTKGFDKLTSTQQGDVAKLVIGRLDQTPAWKVVLDKMTSKQKEEFVKRIVSRPDFRDGVLKGNEAAFTTELVDNVTSLNNEVSVLNTQLDEIVGHIGTPGKKGTLVEVEERIAKIKDEIKEYQVEVADPSAPGGLRVGKNYERVSTTLTDMAMIANDIQPLQIQLEAKQVEVDRYAKEKPSGSRDIAAIQADLVAAKTELASFKTQMTTKQAEYKQKEDLYEKLKNGEGELKNELTEKEGKRSELVNQKTDIEGKLSTKTLELAKARASRSHEEESFVKSIEEVFGKAADGWMDEKVQEAIDAGKAELDNIASKSEDVKKQAFARSLADRYFIGKKVNVQIVRADYQTLLSSGPESLTRSALATAGYTPAEITKIEADSAKFAEFRNQVTENILTTYMLRGGLLRSGGRVSPDEVLKISKATWGHDMIEHAVKGKTDMISAINKAGGDGILSADGKITERFKKHPLRNMALIFLAIAGLLGGGVFGATKI